jgi:hypothetical protein
MATILYARVSTAEQTTGGARRPLAFEGPNHPNLLYPAVDL